MVERYVNKLYSSEEVTAPVKHLVEALEQILKYSNNCDITRDFLYLMFLKPEITRQMHLASARTVDSYKKALRTQDPQLVKEWLFFVFNRGSEGFLQTVEDVA